MGIRKSKLGGLSKQSPYMDIEIDIGEDTISFNLADELAIGEFIEGDIKGHPTIYGYLLTIRSKVRAEVRKMNKKLEETYSEKLIEYRFENKGDSSVTAPLLKALVLTDSTYKVLLSKYNQRLTTLEILEDCIKAIESKEGLLRTLSANYRKERS